MADIRHALERAATTEDVAGALCRFLYDHLVVEDGARACVLVRCYTTQAYGALPLEPQRFAKRAYGRVAFTPPEPTMRCLVLPATVGDEPDWNDRRASRGHQAIPLPSPHIVERAPMVAQLIRELGLDPGQITAPAGNVVRDLAGKGYGVFHVQDAVGSQYIPAQTGFVDRYSIRSVMGFGGAPPPASCSPRSSSHGCPCPSQQRTASA